MSILTNLLESVVILSYNIDGDNIKINRDKIIDHILIKIKKYEDNKIFLISIQEDNLPSFFNNIKTNAFFNEYHIIINSSKPFGNIFAKRTITTIIIFNKNRLYR